MRVYIEKRGQGGANVILVSGRAALKAPVFLRGVSRKELRERVRKGLADLAGDHPPAVG